MNPLQIVILEKNQPLPLPDMLEIILQNNLQNPIVHPSELVHHQESEPRTLSQKEYFFTRKRDRLVKVNICDILWIKASNGSVEIVLPKEKFVASANLKSFSRQVQHQSLLRVHRSYIVNLEKITALSENCLYIPYKSQEERIPISPKYRDDLMKFIPRLRSD
ncbi:MAG: LytTR family DNA-binding domain-containing protein [Bacteroidota bacterium]